MKKQCLQRTQKNRLATSNKYVIMCQRESHKRKLQSHCTLHRSYILYDYHCVYFEKGLGFNVLLNTRSLPLERLGGPANRALENLFFL